MPEIRSAAARPSSFIASPPSDAWDAFIKVFIVCGLEALLWASFRTEMFRPLLRIAEHHGLSAEFAKPGKDFLHNSQPSELCRRA